MTNIKGILFSGSEKNAALAYKHWRDHGVVYWSLTKNLNYSKFHFPIIALLHVTPKKGVRYKYVISDVVKYSLEHHKDLKKKPKDWPEEQKMKKRKFEVTLVISKIFPFCYPTDKLKNWDERTIRGYPQGNYFKIIIP